jgi:hypothetical protein
MSLKVFYNKRFCFKEQACTFEQRRKVKTTNIFVFIKDVFVYLFRAAFSKLVVVLDNDALIHTH